MSTLSFLTHFSKQSRCCFLKQLKQQQKGACSANFLSSWNFQNNRRKHSQLVGAERFSPLLNKQLFASPLCLNYSRFISNKVTPNQTGEKEKQSPAALTDDIFAETSNLGLFAKFKLMYKKYWYVLIPVHIVTSLGWFVGFYYLSQSGVDIPALLTQFHVGENIIEKVKNSTMGHLAIAYLCYKIATPLRYALTLGGTTVSIKYLVQAGYIKPMPTKQELMDMYEQKKADRATAAKEKDK